MKEGEGVRDGQREGKREGRGSERRREMKGKREGWREKKKEKEMEGDREKERERGRERGSVSSSQQLSGRSQDDLHLRSFLLEEVELKLFLLLLHSLLFFSFCSFKLQVVFFFRPPTFPQQTIIPQMWQCP